MYWYFLYPEYFLYGGVAFAVAAVSLIGILAFANRSMVFVRATLFAWPFLLILSCVRAILMIYQLNRRKDYIQWECDNGGQLWSEAAYNGSVVANGTSTLPTGFCSAGVSSFYTAMVISLLVDLGIQFYAFFLTWRYSAFLTEYRKVSAPNMGFYA
ncbi:hypothetical protein BDY24DRAFT_375319 [Mrakia frigida]|uniref:uncharacterized protein n=1 Tax=Mrakia frigida TaxID=29902 RepID=UPI003FCC07AA